MMKHYLRCLALLGCLTSWVAFGAPMPPDNGIHWLTNYEDAVSQSRQTSKPIILVFTGSDWCTWCKKLDKEVFESPEFAERVGDKFIFVWLDFPQNSYQPKEQKQHNEELKHQFAVQGFPTLVILDEKQQKIATAGYQPGGGANYANYLLQIISEYAEYHKPMGKMKEHRFSAAELTPASIDQAS